MAAFVGFCLQSNGVCWPWAQSFDGTMFSDISAAGGPADQWDALPTAAKAQIICVVGFLEMFSETSAALEMDGQKHYVVSQLLCLLSAVGAQGPCTSRADLS